ncbi:MAG: hypothetical protein ABR592_12740 [Nitriliruptorales bacterium]
MGLRHMTRLRAAALGMAAVTLMGLAGCEEGGDENGEDGQMQQDGGEQEEEDE